MASPCRRPIRLQSGAAFAALLLLSGACGPVAAYTPPGKTEKAVKNDVQYIRCGVCEALAKNAYRQVRAMRDYRPGKKLDEMLIIEKMEKMVDPDQPEGEWITKYDLVEKGTKLLLEEQPEAGVCGSECKTIAKAAEEIVGDHDTDIAEMLWKGVKERAAFTKWLCRELTSACKREAPPLPKDRKKGPEFKTADPQDLELNKMMANMKGAGLSGSLFSRDEAMNMAGDGFGEGGDEDDEYEDDDDSAKPVSGKVQSAVTDAVEKAREFSAPLLEKAQELGQPLLETAAQGVAAAKQGLGAVFSKAAGVVSGLTGRKSVDSEL